MKKTLLLLTIATFAFSATSHSQLLNNLVSYWKFDESSDSLLDAVGSNNGTISGAVQGLTGVLGNCYSFDGSADYINVGNDQSLYPGTNDWSFSCWFKTTASLSSSSNIYSIFSNSTGSSANGIQILLRGSSYYGILVRIYHGGVYSDYGPSSDIRSSVNDGSWHHLAVTIDRDGELIIYFDNTPVCTSTSTAAYSSVNLSGTLDHKIGILSNNYSFNGFIDEVGVWSSALTVEEITSLYNNKNGLTYPFGTTYSLNASASPVAGGSITLSPSGGSYSSGSTVTATAVANSGYTFSGWHGEALGTPNPWIITMNSSKSITAKFTAIPTYSLTIVPSENGTITADPVGPNYPAGTVVTLTATPSLGYLWCGWDGGPLGIKNPSTITMNSNRTVGGCFYQIPPGETQNIRLNNFYVSNDGDDEGIKINDNGKVGIGTSNPTEKLTVNGKILATEVEVVSSIASDYVFDPAYQLMPLTELEIYLKQHKHLPGIPSAQEFEKQGQNLGEMQDLLLRKIEELTLYILQQDKYNTEQSKRIEMLQEENRKLKIGSSDLFFRQEQKLEEQAKEIAKLNEMIFKIITK